MQEALSWRMILQFTLASSLYDIYPCLSFLDGPVDFAIRLVDSLASLPHRQVKLFGKFKLL